MGDPIVGAVTGKAQAEALQAQIDKALDVYKRQACDDDILRLAINLAFSCSLRMGELLGLTWDCLDISPTSIELGQASIFVEKELQRVNREAMNYAGAESALRQLDQCAQPHFLV